MISGGPGMLLRTAVASPGDVVELGPPDDVGRR